MRDFTDVFGQVYPGLSWYWDPSRDWYNFRLADGASGIISSRFLFRLSEHGIANAFGIAIQRAVAVAEFAHEFETLEVFD